MRILHVRFKNLNSLVGEWEIDFADPVFSADGIFAITGPTGAGKTTILDAICLALYGRTPRLEKMSENSNEIMSRQTAECFAEVTFETPLGQFRCHWSQYRSRKKADGKLQKPKHEISNAQSGEILESKIRGVAEQIEHTTGMDFDRFTRTMLLAQGGFAAFLQASPDDRAPILEQITGTQIYSDISVRVHQKRADEKRILESLEAQYAGIKLLTPEEERMISSQIEQHNNNIQNLSLQLEQDRQAKGWLEGIANLQKEIAKFDKQYIEILDNMKSFEPAQQQLERATQALELAAGYENLKSFRQQQENNTSHLSDYQKKYCELVDVEAPKAQEARSVAQQQFDKEKATQIEMDSVIRQVRDLDAKIAEKNKPIQDKADQIKKLNEEYEKRKSSYHHDAQALEKIKKNLEELTGFFSQHAVDEGLVEQLTGIQMQLETFDDLFKAHQKIQKTVQEAEKQKNETHQICVEKTKDYQHQQANLEQLGRQLEVKNEQLKNILAGRELSDWREHLELFKNNKNKLENLLASLTKVNELQQTANDLEQYKNKLILNQEDFLQSIKKNTDEKRQIEEKIKLLETQFFLLQTIKNLEEYRNQLHKGEACPLCGSKEHPYANEMPPPPNQTQQELNQEKKKFSIVSAELTKAIISEAEIKKDIQQIESKLKDNLEKSENEKKLISELLSELGLFLLEQTPGSIVKLIEKEDKNIHDTLSTIKCFEQLEKEIKVEQEDFSLTSNNFKDIEISINKALNKKESAYEYFENVKNNFIESEKVLQRKHDDLLQIVSPYGFNEISLNSVKTIKENLSQRRDCWQEKISKKIELEKQQSRLEVQTQNLAETLEKINEEIEENNGSYQLLREEMRKLQQERHELFADQSTEQVEERMAINIKNAEHFLIESNKKCDEIRVEMQTLDSHVNETKRSMQKQEPILKQAEHDFLIRLSCTGFKDESDYQAACLPEETRKTLNDRATSLSVQKKQLEALLQDKKEQLNVEQEKKLTIQSLDELKRNIQDHETQLKNLQEQLGAGQQKLNDNHQSRQKQQAHSQRIDAQKKECARWENLHSLIGSVDGKKYRNFAQGLTFEMMVGHANRQLQKLTDRYLLIRDDKQPLELNVIDNYQAGEIRSTKNLSGGEGFIISLSLALGLSKMASKNVRVDSLFLDEGFGTLDDEALDIALETLSSLREENKLIGVISHVPALKERINTQIKIQLQTGGRSTIVGRGCREIIA